MKRVLIISPYFPPSNAADMHRVRTSLPYFKTFGWDPTVIAVDPQYSEVGKDDLFVMNIPADADIRLVKALPKKLTAKFGLGSLGFRAIWHYRRKVNEILAKEKFDLVYFSTTQFPVCVLGPYWKKRFNIPFVIDMQDPWYSEHYSDKPRSERPPKYRLVYSLHRFLEKMAMKQVAGLVSVSEQYIDDLKSRYTGLLVVPAAMITFGAFEPDITTAIRNENRFAPIISNFFTNIVYVGRGGADMHQAISPVFQALKDGLVKQPEIFNRLKFWFIGTSYAPADIAQPSIAPLAKKYGVENNVVEITGRIGYYQSLSILMHAHALFVPGSDDPKYSASKIYPCLLTRKPLLAIFNEKSNIIKILNDCTNDAIILTFNGENNQLVEMVYVVLEDWAKGKVLPIRLTKKFEKYSAQSLTGQQAQLFDNAVTYHKGTNTNA